MKSDSIKNATEFDQIEFNKDVVADLRANLERIKLVRGATLVSLLLNLVVMVMIAKLMWGHQPPPMP